MIGRGEKKYDKKRFEYMILSLVGFSVGVFGAFVYHGVAFRKSFRAENSMGCIFSGSGLDRYGRCISRKKTRPSSHDEWQSCFVFFRRIVFKYINNKMKQKLRKIKIDERHRCFESGPEFSFTHSLIRNGSNNLQCRYCLGGLLKAFIIYDLALLKGV